MISTSIAEVVRLPIAPYRAGPISYVVQYDACVHVVKNWYSTNQRTFNNENSDNLQLECMVSQRITNGMFPGNLPRRQLRHPLIFRV